MSSGHPCFYLGGAGDADNLAVVSYSRRVHGDPDRQAVVAGRRQGAQSEVNTARVVDSPHAVGSEREAHEANTWNNDDDIID